MSAKLPLNLFTVWLARGERGLSSEAIVEAVTGERIIRYRGDDHPHDPADLWRCVALIRCHPLVGLVFKEAIRGRSRQWAALVDVWDELTDLLDAEMAEGAGRAPRTYARMEEVLRGAS